MKIKKASLDNNKALHLYASHHVWPHFMCHLGSHWRPESKVNARFVLNPVLTHVNVIFTQVL